MLCPKCHFKNTKVLDSRDSSAGRSVRRRRECESCAYRFTTHEKVDTGNFFVIKKSGIREAYDRTKVERGIYRAIEKRPIGDDDVQRIIGMLEETWCTHREIRSEVLGRDVMYALKEVDDVAYIRFASVYRQFKDIDSFLDELMALRDKNKKA